MYQPSRVMGSPGFLNMQSPASKRAAMEPDHLRRLPMCVEAGPLIEWANQREAQATQLGNQHSMYTVS
jgi:hypothetical protein